MSIKLNRSSFVVDPTTAGDVASKESVRYAIEDLHRDLNAVFDDSDSDKGALIRLVEADMPQEHYHVRVIDGSLVVQAGDDLGFIYGLYAISREVLGVSDLWFWNDQRLTRRVFVELSEDFFLQSTPQAVRYKGFFLNDEVLLEDWSVDNDPELPWRRAFETILRLGGNTVIPGSGQRGEPHLPLARRMGLYINQHHATPLGAKMFSEAYAGVQPRWPEERSRFEALWRDAVQAGQGGRTIWTLGFRGQGDTPFWAADPRYDNDETRGQVMSEVIRRQYDLVREADPNAPVSVYLYGESMDLYRKGVLCFPDDVIKIWSDNGFGRMVSRRQGNDNPRVNAMPIAEDHGRNGIYYHASFYDLQAANHITQLCVDPHRIASELEQVLVNGGDDLWIVNASNIKPHVFMLYLIAQLWRDGHVDVDDVESRYATEYYGESSGRGEFGVVDMLEGYWQASASYGSHWDDKAGEQFFNHVPRMLAVQFMRDRRQADPELKWMCDMGGFVADTLADQVRYYRSLCDPATDRYRELEAKASAFVSHESQINRQSAELIRDSLLLQIRLYLHCVSGAALLCRGLEYGMAEDWRHAFYYAGLAREEYLAADQAMRSREHGKWSGFWRNDCLTDVKQTAMVLGALMGYLRALGDGPHYYQWKRDFLYPAWEKDVMVIMNMENHESDQEIFAAMKRAWQS